MNDLDSLAQTALADIAAAATLDALGYDEFGNARHLLTENDAHRLLHGDWNRADGDVLCPDCGQPFRVHPEVQGALWLRRVCRDRLVKL